MKKTLLLITLLVFSLSFSQVNNKNIQTWTESNNTIITPYSYPTNLQMCEQASSSHVLRDGIQIQFKSNTIQSWGTEHRQYRRSPRGTKRG